MCHEATLFLASEGSFGPHPYIPFINSDMEALLFWDRESNQEIYVEAIGATNSDEITVQRKDDINFFLEKVGFPRQGLIVHPASAFSPIFKGIHSKDELLSALHTCFDASFDTVKISVDLRACHSPMRQKVIVEAGKKLIDRLKSLCPRCHRPGFSISRIIEGLPCNGCGIRTKIAKQIVWRCNVCQLESEQDRPDGKAFAEAAECQFCNP